jgi:uncharacterized protein (TIGR03435 family)
MEAGKLTGQGVPVSELIGMLSRQNLGRTIVDKTGLTGDYDFILQWIPDKGSNVPDTGIFTAIREQLGLELKSQDEPQEILIIDHVEKPADN